MDFSPAWLDENSSFDKNAPPPWMFFHLSLLSRGPVCTRQMADDAADGLRRRRNKALPRCGATVSFRFILFYAACYATRAHIMRSPVNNRP